MIAADSIRGATKKQGDSKPRHWRQDEVELFKELAHRISLRIERARAEEALRRSEEQYRIQYEQKMSGRFN